MTMDCFFLSHYVCLQQIAAQISDLCVSNTKVSLLEE